VPSLPGDDRARRRASNLGLSAAASRLRLEAYRATARYRPRQRLMVTSTRTESPPDWADTAAAADPRCAEPPAGQPPARRGLAAPDAAAASRCPLPADPRLQVEAMRQAQRQGVSAFALCPDAPALPPVAGARAAFSPSTYPYRP
jgi:hypothetical protein